MPDRVKDVGANPQGLFASSITAPLRIRKVLQVAVFEPFHYGYRDEENEHRGEPEGHSRAANELTLTEWDPVSKQPVFKNAAVRVERIGDES